jgi:adenylate cyclase, class 2
MVAEGACILPAMAREVEIKFLVDDVPALEARLRSAGFQQQTPPTHEMNTLYDRLGHPLRRRGQLLRLREFGGEWRLTHKARGKSGRHKSRAELETVVADGAQMDAILQALGFEPTFRYEKFRSDWTDGQGHVVLDKTPIGDLAEIEGEPAWIDTTAAKLGVAESEYITKSYAEMFLDWKRRTRNKAQDMTFAECRS